jgi:hypothetical protein
MVAVVNVLALLKVEECDLVLQVAHFVANRNAISGSENGVREDFAEKRDFVEHFCFSHISNLAKFLGKVKFFLSFFGYLRGAKSRRLRLLVGNFHFHISNLAKFLGKVKFFFKFFSFCCKPLSVKHLWLPGFCKALVFSDLCHIFCQHPHRTIPLYPVSNVGKITIFNVDFQEVFAHKKLMW